MTKTGSYLAKSSSTKGGRIQQVVLCSRRPAMPSLGGTPSQEAAVTRTRVWDRLAVANTWRTRLPLVMAVVRCLVEDTRVVVAATLAMGFYRRVTCASVGGDVDGLWRRWRRSRAECDFRDLNAKFFTAITFIYGWLGSFASHVCTRCWRWIKFFLLICTSWPIWAGIAGYRPKETNTTSRRCAKSIWSVWPILMTQRNPSSFNAFLNC